MASQAARRGPMSVDEIIQKKRDEEAALAKPKFLSKKDRERIALEKLAKEREAKQQQHQQNGTSNSTTSTNSITTNGTSSTNSTPVPSAPRSMQQQKGDSRNFKGSSRDAAKVPSPPSETENLDPETKLLRERYMGIAEVRRQKRRRTASDRKFTFDWKTEDDTFSDYNPIYRGEVSASLGLKNTGEAEEKKKRALELQDIPRKKKDTDWDNMHWSEKPLDKMKERDWRIFKEDFSISTKGGSVPNPMRSWEESGLPPEILRAVEEVGYKEPSAIQRAAIPVALSCRDVIGVAETGSGKTASFVLPLLSYIIEMPVLNEVTKSDGPYAIILAPTRELAQQIETETRKFCNRLGFRCVSIVGGHTISEQSFALQEGAEIVIATPGRLVDCIERRVLVLSQCCYVIMDEADRMIDLGFEEQVNKILEALPVTNTKPDNDDAENARLMSTYLGGKDRYRQTMMYTATMPPAIERIARQYLRRPATVIIGSAGQAVGTVEQRVEFVTTEEKRRRRMGEILNSGEFQAPVIVFVNIKKNCDMVARELNRIGWKAVILHGGKSQDQREAALKQLRDGEADALVATDLAGRGIDVPDVSLVLNFNMAKNIEDYTHRIGRTGRAGKSGVAMTFLSNDDQDTFYDLKQMLSKSALSKVPDELRRHEAAQAKFAARKMMQNIQ
ncbi:P-loop containing nucleoside triphosphate hydrolase protein [Lipomyces chichibuensis]|uniref:P-loop containing nucleoside triphosphate hydrolase protein n=1 Tax=Lipomyces chichibuensis TaxID=1546026 RepID=UPI0033431142